MSAPLIAHVIHHLVIGGLENGLINLINRIPNDRYRHAIICIDDFSDFKERIINPNVEIYAIRKRPGRDFSANLRLYRLLKKIQPTILHSRNLSGLNALFPALLAGINYRIHGEHGRDVDDLYGNNRKLQWLRRLYRPFISHYIPLSHELERYLIEKIGVDSNRITQIYNGVDIERFKPSAEKITPLPVENFCDQNSVIIGTVGRFQQVKDQMNLANGFIHLLNNNPGLSKHVRLAMIGEGPLRKQVLEKLKNSGYSDLVWAPGPRDDIDTLLPSINLFVLPSLAEGISNTLLEAMACGLPIVATAVGGNPELVVDGVTGTLIPPANSKALATALLQYLQNKQKLKEHGLAGRKRAVELFSISAMVEQYISVYDRIRK